MRDPAKEEQVREAVTIRCYSLADVESGKVIPIQHKVDRFTKFIEGYCLVGPIHKDTSIRLYEAYRDYCIECDAIPLSHRLFSSRLIHEGFMSHRGTKGSRGWLGIRLNGVKVEENDGYRQHRTFELRAARAVWKDFLLEFSKVVGDLKDLEVIEALATIEAFISPPKNHESILESEPDVHF